jgi:hypothetical protein
MKGAANELKAAGWFLDQGGQVYWPSAQQSHIDFIADYQGSLRRVQVKTATWNRGSPPYAYLQCRVAPSNSPLRGAAFDHTTRYDLLFVVHGSEFWLIPADCLNTTNLCLRSTGPRNKAPWDHFKCP